MTTWSHIKLLIWKNTILQKRAPIATLLELGLPTLLAAILLALRTIVVYEEFDKPYYWNLTTVPYSPTFEEKGPWKLMYAPETPVTTRVMNTVHKRLLYGRQNPYDKNRGGSLL